MANFIKIKLSLQIQSESKKAKNELGVHKLYFSETHNSSVVSFDYMVNFKGFKEDVSYILATCSVKTLLFIRDAIRNKEYYGYDDRSKLVRP